MVNFLIILRVPLAEEVHDMGEDFEDIYSQKRDTLVFNLTSIVLSLDES